MKTIWKYAIEPDTSKINMPLGAEILCVQTQSGEPCIWAKVDPSNLLEERRFVTYGTGHRLTDGQVEKYIGTFQVSGGALVFHLFEIVSFFPSKTKQS